jgi:hypothetical protein
MLNDYLYGSPRFGYFTPWNFRTSMAVLKLGIITMEVY